MVPNTSPKTSILEGPRILLGGLGASPPEKPPGAPGGPGPGPRDTWGTTPPGLQAPETPL